MDKHEPSGRDGMRTFIAKVAVTALFVVILLLLRSSISVLMMILAATLIALYFYGLAGIIEKNWKLPQKWSMTVSITGSFVLLSLLLWLIGARVQQQIQTLSKELPSMVQQAKAELNKSSVGQQVLKQSSGENAKKLVSSAQKFFSSTFGVLGDIYIILFLGIFFTADPQVYKEGVVALIPPDGKEEGRRVLEKLADNLKSWLKGKMFSMAVVAVLTGIGLTIVGVPMVFALAIIAGVMNFIPNFGPIIAMVPAVLIGLTQGPNTAIIIAGLYIFIQVLESNLITPMVQKKLASIPPAMIIIGQLTVGAFTGYLGLILATPVVLITMILVNELYVKKQHSSGGVP